jgi:hypothetical protein
MKNTLTVTQFAHGVATKQEVKKDRLRGSLIRAQEGQKISNTKFLIDLFAKWEKEEEVLVVLSSELLSV